MTKCSAGPPRVGNARSSITGACLWDLLSSGRGVPFSKLGYSVSSTGHLLNDDRITQSGISAELGGSPWKSATGRDTPL